jgi:hypothetical protein
VAADEVRAAIYGGQGAHGDRVPKRKGDGRKRHQVRVLQVLAMTMQITILTSVRTRKRMIFILGLCKAGTESAVGQPGLEPLPLVSPWSPP